MIPDFKYITFLCANSNIHEFPHSNVTPKSPGVGVSCCIADDHFAGPAGVLPGNTNAVGP